MRPKGYENLLKWWQEWYWKEMLKRHLRSEYLRICKSAPQASALWERGENILLLRVIVEMEEGRQCS